MWIKQCEEKYKVVYFHSATAVWACFAACFSFFFFISICFFSSGVFFSPFIFRVCSRLISCLPMWMRPIFDPNASLEIFFFVPILSSWGTLQASLYRSSDANLVLLSFKSTEGPTNIKIIYYLLHIFKFQYCLNN